MKNGPIPNPQAIQKRKNRLIRQLKALGYEVQVTATPKRTIGFSAEALA